MGEDAAERKEVNLRVVLSAEGDLEAVYTNVAEVTQTQFDTEIYFGRVPGKLAPARLDEALETGELLVEPTVKIVMPKEVAKGLAEAIIRNLEGVPDPWKSQT